HAPGVADAIGVAHREANAPGVADPFGVAHREANAPGNARSGARMDTRTGDVEPVAPIGTGSAAEERIPGADPMWQAPDMSWRPLPLGLEDEWPPELWPPEGDPATAGTAAGDVAERRHDRHGGAA